ncbi:MAG TPA: pantoate--beta-alanine ligase [Stellaceae bacterium]|nr:pantoate--beta-alanine ligase [Stellaceae bacterium]
MRIARSIGELRDEVARWRREGARTGLVPTMGALHEGHLALVERAKAECGRTIASIFVNPKQFAPNEDFAAYPRGEAADLEKLRETGVDVAFLPTVAEIYPEGFSTLVRVGGLSEGLCGAGRPGHFDGVATVVTKLLLQSRPDAAYFGEKDYQQLLIVRRLARDLDIPTVIVGVPTRREPDGLAMSSRNLYLSPEERRAVPELARVLRQIAAALAREPGAVAREVARGLDELKTAGFAVEYLELRDAATLAPVPREVRRPARILVAARLARTRLIDNWPVEPPP